MAVVELNHTKKEHMDHSASINFQKAINPGTKEDFKREYAYLYPDRDQHFDSMRVIK